jgi:ABC-2 type transport system ATP-binding protein
MIELVELTKYYGEAKAVGPLSLNIEAGEVVGLLGLNGAGKTTTLRMLASDLLPTCGSMTVDGVDLCSEPEKIRPMIGYLPDRPPLYNEMSVRECLTFAARLRKMPKSKVAKRVEEVIEQTDVGDYADASIGVLSHGFRQRVGIGQAIVHQPKLLLLDEPISGLDPVQIVEMRRLIRSFRGDHTIVLSSHILSEIQETCDRLLVLRDGQIVASGSEEALSRQMAGQGLHVTVAPAQDQSVESIAQLLEKVDGVVSAESTACNESAALRFRVVTKQDVRAELCRALVSAEHGVLALERSGSELESVFLQLAGKDLGT